MKVTRNYDDTPEQGDYNLMPDGQYMFEIAEVEDKYSSGNDPMPNITLNCIEEGEYEGNKIWDNILIPEPDSPAYKIIGRTKRFLHAIGEDYLGDFDVDTDNWINKTVEVRIVTEEYNGRKRNVVSRYILSEKQQNKPDIPASEKYNKLEQEEKQKDLPF